MTHYRPRPARVNVRLLLALAVLSVAAVVGIAALFFSWVSTPLGLTADQIDPSAVAELRVQLLNRPDGKDDIGPIVMRPDDFAALLAPLKGATAEADKPGMPWLGEYQVRFADGRRLTIRLRYERRAFAPSPAVAAATGGGAAVWDASTVWFVIEDRIYRGRPLAELLRIAEECAARAKG